MTPSILLRLCVPLTLHTKMFHSFFKKLSFTGRIQLLGCTPTCPLFRAKSPASAGSLAARGWISSPRTTHRQPSPTLPALTLSRSVPALSPCVVQLTVLSCSSGGGNAAQQMRVWYLECRTGHRATYIISQAVCNDIGSASWDEPISQELLKVPTTVYIGDFTCIISHLMYY